MFNSNWPLNHNTSTPNVDWSALADTWMQQREQQVHWQQAPPPLPPPPPPPQFLLGAPPIRPPGPPPIGMTFPPLPPTQLGIRPHHHQLQVGSNTTQESLTMTNIENAAWRPPPLPFMMSGGPQWRPNTNNHQPLFPLQPDMAPSFGGRNFWPPGNTGQQAAPPPPVPPPVPPPPPLPPVSAQSSHMPPQFPTSSFPHPSVDKRMMNTSFNTSIPSLMDLPSSYGPKSIPPPVPVPPVPILPIEPTSTTRNTIPSGSNANAKRRKIPAWLREELGRIGKEKEKKMQNTSNNNLSINDSSSKFDDEDDEDDDDNEDEKNDRTVNESPTTFSDDNEDEDEEENDDEGSSFPLISSTPMVTRRSRFDDDNSTEQQLNVSAIAKRTHSPPLPTSMTKTLIEDNPVDKEEQFMMKLRRALTELLLEVTNEELALLGKEVYMDCKAESSTPVIRKASGLTSLVQSFSGSDSDDEEKYVQSIINTTVITKSPMVAPVKQNNVPNPSIKSLNKTFDEEDKSSKTKKKKSTRERTPSPSSTSRDSKEKKHHHKKHRRRSSSSSSNSSQTRSDKKKKSSHYNQHSQHTKYDDRGRKH